METPSARSSFSSKLCFILFLLISNVITLTLFSSDSPFRINPTSSSSLLESLAQARQEIIKLQTQLKTSHGVSEQLLAQLTRLGNFITDNNSSSSSSRIDNDSHLTPEGINLPREYLEFVNAHPFPLGRNPNTQTDVLYPPVGRACDMFSDDLRRFMDYSVGGECPDDELLGQQLLLKGCEPLPRRRCRNSPSQLPENYVEPIPIPDSLWSTPDDSSVTSWTAYSCKNYACLVNRKNDPGFSDCKDCFDLAGRESHRWTGPGGGGGLDYSMDEVLAVKPPGSIRIGLDLGGGTATFAVRMRERNVTIVTTSMNLNGPFNQFIASRGMIPLYISISQRLPFFDVTLDIVHSMHVLSNWIPSKLLEFILYDIFRVLRPGGLFWLDHFFCVEDQLNELYVPMIERIGFEKVKWTIGRKMDRGPELREMYISALLQKPSQKLP